MALRSPPGNERGRFIRCIRRHLPNYDSFWRRTPGPVPGERSTGQPGAKRPSACPESAALVSRSDALPLKDQAPILRWPDYSGHQRDASPTIEVHEGVGTPPSFVKSSTIHGYPAVRFSQDNGLATPGDSPVDLSGDAALTIFVVANLKYQDASGRAVIVGFGEVLDPSNTTPGQPGAALLEIDRTPEGRHRLDHAGRNETVTDSEVTGARVLTDFRT